MPKRPTSFAFFFALVSLLLASCVTTPAPRQSPNDDRAYRYLELDNGLEVLLISDADTDKAAAALAVFRGSYDEPPGRPGLAHFLEHMLFLGTEKYPTPDEYSSFVTTHGGSNNAYTASDHTNYFFDIEPSRLEDALDRFAQFFTAPLFAADYVEREKKAVHSEYQLQLKDDGWRAFAVSKVTFNPSHPASRFSIGSLETLEGDVRADLVEFFEREYSADAMALVVLGREPLDALEAWVTPRFAAIPDRDVAPPADPGPLFADDKLPMLLTYRTIQQTRRLVFNFPVPSPDRYYEEKPLEFIANLLGHEGEGSLHAWLKARGWIESLAAAGERVDRDNGVVSVSIELTDDGTEHVDEITAGLFAYIDLMRKQGLDRWRYEEQARIAELGFRFKEDTSALRYVYGIAPRFQLYPPSDVLAGPHLMTRFDEPLIRRFLASLRPDNVLVEVAGPDVETDRVERWFQVPYRLGQFETQSSADAKAATLALPAPNPFVPGDLSLIDEVESLPVVAIEGPGLTVWLASDTRFRVPRATVYVEIDVPSGLSGPRDVVAAHLHARLVRDRLNEYAYPAEIAGLDYTVSVDDSGFLIAVTGYDDKQLELIERILEAFELTDVDAAKLALYAAELEKNWRNFATERPYTQTFARLDHVLLSSSWSPERLSASLAGIDAAELEKWLESRLARMSATVLMHGNVTAADARRMAELLQRELPLGGEAAPEPQVARIDSGPLVLATDVDHTDAAIAVYVQGRSESLRERALFGLAGQILRTPFFTDLRTEQQLGYAVIATPAPIRRTPGLAFLVQSPVAGPAALVDATERFLTSYAKVLAAMPAEEFEAHKQGLISRLLERDRSLFERSQRFWSDLELGFTGFDSRERIAREVASIGQEEFLEFYQRLVGARERLIVYSSGSFDGAPAGNPLQSLEVFKSFAAHGEASSSRRNGGSASSNDRP